MGSPTLLRLSMESLSNLATKHASEKIRLLIKRQVTVSKRQRSWFRLNLQERSIIDLALRLKVSFRSPELLRAVASIMERLQQVGNKWFSEQLLRGSKLAWSFSEAAVSWGNAAAKNWRSDMTYIAFLGRFSRSTRP
jgi:hypothetical protein